MPGVSGGTIALITGIYDRFINAISSVGLATLKSFLTGKLREAWTAIDGNFLVVLGAGIGTAIVSLASILNYLMTAYPLPLWSTFCGLVLDICIQLIKRYNPKERQKRKAKKLEKHFPGLTYV